MFEQIILAVLILEVTYTMIYSVTSTIIIVTAPYVAVLIVVRLIWLQRMNVIVIQTVPAWEFDELYNIKYKTLGLSILKHLGIT